MFSGPRKGGGGQYGPYTLSFITDCESGYSDALPVKYAHLAIVYDENGEPLVIVSAEYDEQYEEAKDGPLALGVFDQDGHHVVDHRDNLRDLKVFAEEARPLVEQHFASRG